MDKYEEKLVDLTQKYDSLKSETKKHKEDAKRYREQREQCKLTGPMIAQFFWFSFFRFLNLNVTNWFFKCEKK